MHILWVVEMQDDKQREWHATIGARLTKEDGRAELRDWKDNNPYDRFRLVKYVRSE